MQKKKLTAEKTPAKKPKAKKPATAKDGAVAKKVKKTPAKKVAVGLFFRHMCQLVLTVFRLHIDNRTACLSSLSFGRSRFAHCLQYCIALPGPLVSYLWLCGFAL